MDFDKPKVYGDTFISDGLVSSSSPTQPLLRWEVEEEGEFRIVDSSMVARLWATVKGNKKMNYEKLSRAMR